MSGVSHGSAAARARGRGHNAASPEQQCCCALEPIGRSRRRGSDGSGRDVCRDRARDTPRDSSGCVGRQVEPLPGSDGPIPSAELRTSEPQLQDHLELEGGSAARCSERLLNRIQRRIGIQAGMSVSPKALQPLIDHLSISFRELRAHLLGSDRVPERLHQLQPLSQGQRQQVFHQVLCRPGPENCLRFTVARGWGRGTSGLPSSWLRRRLADQSEEGLESGSVGFGWVEASLRDQFTHPYVPSSSK